MITWANLFDGYDVYADVFSAHPQMYTDLSGNSAGAFDLYHQMIIELPHDVILLFEIFIASVVPVVTISALVYVFFMPILRRPQRW